MFATHFESCIRDKFMGLSSIIEVDSSYIKNALKQYQ